MGSPEAWLRGPIDGVPAALMPVAHSLTDALEEFEASAAGLTVEQLWRQPAGAASIGFHLRHTCGALDRLLTYARGDALSAEQMAALKAEREPGTPRPEADVLLAEVRGAVADAIDVLRTTSADTLLDARVVGRAGLPSSVQGLLFHAAEHTRRHAGQVIATARFVREESATPTEVRADLLATLLGAWEDAGVRGLCGEGRFEAAVGAVRAR